MNKLARAWGALVRVGGRDGAMRAAHPRHLRLSSASHHVRQGLAWHALATRGWRRIHEQAEQREESVARVLWRRLRVDWRRPLRAPDRGGSRLPRHLLLPQQRIRHQHQHEPAVRLLPTGPEGCMREAQSLFISPLAGMPRTASRRERSPTASPPSGSMATMSSPCLPPRRPRGAPHSSTRAR